MTATLPRPGDSVTVTTSPFPTVPITTTGTWFVAGLTEKGPLKALRVESLQDFVNKFGGRQSWSVLYDAIDEYFSDGGAQAYVGRVVGPANKVASHILEDASAGESLKAEAIGPGEYANNIKVKITKTSETFVVEVLVGAVVVEISPVFTTQAAAVSWSQLSSYILLKLGASSLLPKTQEVTLAGGEDNRAGIVDASWVTALNLFGKTLGPGQVSQAGRTTATAYANTLQHALEYNRFALLDAPQSGTVSTVT